ncbi:MAG: HD domain-containing protein [Gemmatimonadetes bacterium]|nr:HD domain-containing protein [Gemmatimonadota bacterium]
MSHVDQLTPSQAQDEGRAVLTSFYAAMRALKLYPLENVTVQQALQDLHRRAGVVVAREGALELRVVGDFFFINETRLRLDLSNFSVFGGFARQLHGHGVGGFAILQGFAPSEWVPLLALLLRDPEGDDPFDAFSARFAASPIQHIEVLPAHDAPNESEDEESMEAAKVTYAKSVKVAKDVLHDVRLGRAVNVRKMKRAVQGIVDQVLANEPSIITMTTLRDFDEYTFTHSVNVSIFSVVIGQRLGLSRLQLYELGLCALFHDVGKMRIDPQILNATGTLTDAQWERMQDHPVEGLLVLFEMKGFVDVPYRQMLAAYEHHMKVDVTGYPKNRRPRQPGLFSRIVAVADAFDAGTSVRSYQYKPGSPNDVLKEMRDNPARGFDPILVRALINATGVFPVGTLVILDSLELAVVARSNPDSAHLHQPVVRVISDAMGNPLPQPLALDLSMADPDTGVPARTIIKTTDPEKYGIKVADFLL